MKTEYITRVKLTASDGMVLTNGTVYGKVIFLAEGADKSAYYEITQAEYDAILQAQSEAEHEKA